MVATREHGPSRRRPALPTSAAASSPPPVKLGRAKACFPSDLWLPTMEYPRLDLVSTASLFGIVQSSLICECGRCVSGLSKSEISVVLTFFWDSKKFHRRGFACLAERDSSRHRTRFLYNFLSSAQRLLSENSRKQKCNGRSSFSKGTIPA